MTDILPANAQIAMMQATQAKAGATQTIDEQKAETAAKEFEAVFVAEMLKPMFEGISTDGEFGGGKGEEVFRGLLINEYGKILAETDSIGIAQQVKTEMLKIQEKTGQTEGVTQ